jgi:NADH-quinone oxidoreductase subunit J
VVVLFLFAVMLLGADKAEESPDLRRYQTVAAVLLGALLALGIIWALIPPEPEAVQALMRTDNVQEIGAALLTKFMIPFELASVVLLVAIIGAVVLAKKRLEG